MTNLINLFYGVSTDIPLTIDNLQSIQVDKDKLLKDGIQFTLTTDDLYTVIAVNKADKIYLNSLKQAGFLLETCENCLKEYIIYYGEEPSTDTATVLCEFCNK